jgi:dienelactone hydrolase
METALIPVEGVFLEGDLGLPHGAKGLAIFAHGSGSSRFSPRNRSVAAAIRTKGVATLLFDLLTQNEERLDAGTGHLRFDIGLLARRLRAVASWARAETATRRLPIGYFGASTGGAAALVAAADDSRPIVAVVSRGGRPDLAGDALEQVKCPVLLIVGGEDKTVLRLNEIAFARLDCEKRLAVIPGATHLFEEPGTLDAVAELAGDWFVGRM